MDELNLNVAILGATASTYRTLLGAYRNGLRVVGVLGLDPSRADNISGFAVPDIQEFCWKKKIPFQTFTDVNSGEVEECLRNWNVDLLFAVGFSQIVGKDVLSVPTRGTIGFHPTRLPEGRGRAPLAWLTYNILPGAANFFIMREGVDDGPILAQELFEVGPDDYAGDVEEKILTAIDAALDRWIPRLLRGEWEPIPQDEDRASYTGIRRSVDGLIGWQDPLDTTYNKIRAASHPHPGAYTFAGDRKVIIWRAGKAANMSYRGVPGRVLLISPELGVMIQAGEGLLWLNELEYADSPAEEVKLKVGQRLGYVVEQEIFKLKQEISWLKDKLAEYKGIKR
jgi:methionyl-tRNA formyltransferase